VIVISRPFIRAGVVNVMALVVAVLAAYPPPARASRVDPLAALRHD
jgi:ABC-type lipoprotein release transport system permease subunit